MHSEVEGWDDNVLFLQVQVLRNSWEEFTNSISSITIGVLDCLDGLRSSLGRECRHFGCQAMWQALLHMAITEFSGLTDKLSELSLCVTAPLEWTEEGEFCNSWYCMKNVIVKLMYSPSFKRQILCVSLQVVG